MTTTAASHRRSLATGLVVAVLAATMLTQVTSSSTPTAAALPSFYDVPSPLPAGAPGEIIRSEAITPSRLNGSLYRVMYHSRSATGADIAVTGMVALPGGPPPVGGFPVISWAHVTTGMADGCAPSLGGASKFPNANTLLGQGWAVVATDYEGMGTPGVHPYLVGDSEAHAEIDIVRAARSLFAGQLSRQYVIWGHSQGGHAAAYGALVAAGYAPELDPVGAVASAPPAVFGAYYSVLKGTSGQGYLLMILVGINAAYGDTLAPLDQVLSPAGLALVPLADQDCSSFEHAVGHASLDSLLVRQANGSFDPHANPSWAKLMDAQDPFAFPSPSRIPIVINHGGKDTTVPAIASQVMADHLCSIGQGVERWLYPTKSHGGVSSASLQDTLRWIQDRFDGQATPDPYQPTGTSDVQVTTCVDGKMIAGVVAAPPPTSTTTTTTTTTTSSVPTSTVPATSPTTVAGGDDRRNLADDHAIDVRAAPSAGGSRRSRGGVTDLRRLTPLGRARRRTCRPGGSGDPSRDGRPRRTGCRARSS